MECKFAKFISFYPRFACTIFLLYSLLFIFYFYALFLFIFLVFCALFIRVFPLCTDYLTLEPRAIYDICSATIRVYGTWFVQIMSRRVLTLALSTCILSLNWIKKREREREGERASDRYWLSINNRRVTFAIAFRTEQLVGLGGRKNKCFAFASSLLGLLYHLAIFIERSVCECVCVERVVVGGLKAFYYLRLRFNCVAHVVGHK